MSEIKEQLSLSLTRRFGLKTHLEIDNLLKKHEFSLESLNTMGCEAPQTTGSSLISMAENNLSISIILTQNT